MPAPRLLVDYETAKELATSLAVNESSRLKGADHYIILDQHASEEPWGWVFQPVVEPYWSSSSICPYGGAWNVTVDRFSGKVQLVAHAEIENDEYPVLDLVLYEVGTSFPSVFRLARQLTGWTAEEAKNRLESLPTIIVSGPMISVRSIHESFLTRGAKTVLMQKEAKTNG